MHPPHLGKSQALKPFIHAFEIKHFNRIGLPVKNTPPSFIDAQDIGEITAKVLTHPQQHQNTG